MKSLKIALVTALAAIPVIGLADSFTSNFYTDNTGGLKFTTSTGASLTDSYIFDVGYYAGGSWSSLGTANWDSSIGASQVSLYWDAAVNPYSLGGTQLYGKVSGGNESAIFTSSSWVLPTLSSTSFNPVAYDYAIFSSDPTAKVGSNLTFMPGQGSMSNNTIKLAVPEPSTYAAILGALTIGVVGYRRFRRS